MQILPKVFVKNHELADAQGREQKGNGQPCRIHRQQKNASGNRVASGRKRQNGGENGSDAGGPAEGEGESKQETAPDPWLGDAAAKVHVAIEPARHRRTEKANQRKRE